MAKPARSSKQRRRSRADDILKSAERVFARHGYGETSLRMLMSAARVSTTAFYSRFPSREAVLDALVERFVEDLASKAIARLAEVRTLEAGFEAGIDVLAEHVSGRKPLVRLLLSEAPASAASKAALGRGYAGLAELLSSRMEPLVARGQLEAAHATSLGWSLVGAIKMQVERWALFDELGDRDLREALLTTARALLPALRPPAKRSSVGGRHGGGPR
jgi:AcrR family transcriptional regulator